ncbi:hypothetical protein Tcan_18468 [Toxocara canis]|uniref:Uncharacterized protein n=1 Tax=Toxocara canis TaxID=6265 RepID=A0A0B2US16_TOXCA|nr:hypothetical protein Tcan_18468 [Toxocara canis]
MRDLLRSPVFRDEWPKRVLCASQPTDLRAHFYLLYGMSRNSKLYWKPELCN